MYDNCVTFVKPQQTFSVASGDVRLVGDDTESHFTFLLVEAHCFSIKWFAICKNVSERGFSVVIGKTCRLHIDCEDGERTCPLGKINSFSSCIPESGVCDGIQDCVGGTDEVNCGPSKTFIVNSYCSMTGRML